mmetsp:Transcript_32675/g.59377  ORF Transcript_32675/g.59377 Transcript_32675/m.59377 type:complete len:96 (+) Transcript_32675:74-361(+)|eukprot:CAMPEP_0197647620 /NCGR_PEP_ID=MMETSP1338-20131121/25950_1 /TAXON_ID=43686 ORGANISM="Pelagodinium beii, Strain RCC1491" /NCGR_SAMPLE_ID=MMETSP1338 /ASSEMBLY_ACC=CAM_ASM_000754 /LENGTH=95 /DNA_ID=CAMNT_0043221463 /DNA_START=68 /DNA_END=355 /DNA_ORIENTATION=+
MARSGSMVMSIALLLGCAWLSQTAFLAAPGQTTSLRGAAPAASATALAGFMLAEVPDAAQAFSEKEQYQFGLVFIPFFLVFYVAALVRMFTLGKL